MMKQVVFAAALIHAAHCSLKHYEEIGEWGCTLWQCTPATAATASCAKDHMNVSLGMNSIIYDHSFMDNQLHVVIQVRR
jgi:hypothetical protein